MKTLLSLLVIAVPAALVLAPLPFEIAASLICTGGIVGLAYYDYSRTNHPWAGAPATRGSVRRHRARLGLAA